MDQNAKQQVVEYIKQANNVLVTVSANPSVDQLSAALGFTLLLNKLNKHATAVVSGAIPPAISFLQPNKTFSSSVDGLRDFIIALDKDKADKLRYKVEADVVRIFITPYQGEITKDDLQFSQGDFNVDVVVALGVTNREDLDTAIKAHGRILHDATVLTINAGSQKSNIGAVDWQDVGAGSLSEMIVSISEAFQGGLLDAQISTAFLTGIVSSTERFSNNKTTPKIMTMAAQLMAAGANQQLIANNLNFKPPGGQQQPAQQEPLPVEDASELKLDHGGPGVVAAPPPPPMPPPLPQVPQAPQALPPIDASSSSTPPLFAPPPLPPQQAPPFAAQPQAPVPPQPSEHQFPEIRPSQSITPPPPPPIPQKPAGPPPGGQSLTDIEKEIASLASPKTKKGKKKFSPVADGSEPPKILKSKQERLPDPPEPKLDDDGQPKEANSRLITNVKGVNPTEAAEKPMLGGTFNATTDVAHEDAEKELTKGVNRAILDHPHDDQPAEAKPPDVKPPPPSPFPQSSAAKEPDQTLADLDVKVGRSPSPLAAPAPAPAPASSPPQPPPPEPPSAVKPKENPAEVPGALNVDDARAAVEQAVVNQSFDPANHPTQSINAETLVDEAEDLMSTEIQIDPSGQVLPAKQEPAPPQAQTLAIPGAPVPSPSSPPSGMPPLASDSLDDPPPSGL